MNVCDYWENITHSNYLNQGIGNFKTTSNYLTAYHQSYLQLSDFLEGVEDVVQPFVKYLAACADQKQHHKLQISGHQFQKFLMGLKVAGTVAFHKTSNYLLP